MNNYPFIHLFIFSIIGFAMMVFLWLLYLMIIGYDKFFKKEPLHAQTKNKIRLVKTGIMSFIVIGLFIIASFQINSAFDQKNAHIQNYAAFNNALLSVQDQVINPSPIDGSIVEFISTEIFGSPIFAEMDSSLKAIDPQLGQAYPDMKKSITQLSQYQVDLANPTVYQRSEFRSNTLNMISTLRMGTAIAEGNQIYLYALNDYLLTKFFIFTLVMSLIAFGLTGYFYSQQRILKSSSATL